jgi:hypothetical protein
MAERNMLAKIIRPRIHEMRQHFLKRLPTAVYAVKRAVFAACLDDSQVTDNPER